MSPGQKSYEEDVAARPTYHDGSPRKAWHELCEVARWSWERSPVDEERRKGARP